MSRAVDVVYVREQAEKCRRLAYSITEGEAAATLRGMDRKYEILANRLETRTLYGALGPMNLPPQS